MNRLSLWRTICLVCVFCTLAVIGLSAETFKTLLSFNRSNGANPVAGVVQGMDGNFYGTTFNGGTHDVGTVFKISPAGKLTTLYNFCSQSGCADGQYPPVGLLLANDGNFYGTTSEGGDTGAGTVFKITRTGQLTTLYNFCSQPDCTDGRYPDAGLVQATNGNFYGTTTIGGGPGLGTAFEITPGGQLTTLYSFCSHGGCADGAYPQAVLVQATNGNLYGTTSNGGANSVGTVFKITPGGNLTTIHSFDGTDGQYPYAGLVQATNGNLYGTTDGGGASGNGTVFEITPGGNLTTVHSFDGTDGIHPLAGLVQATNGNFYGTTDVGGAYGNGTIFVMTAGGRLTTLYSFCPQLIGCTDGQYPDAPLMQATNGNFYGTTKDGGTSNACSGECGTVFSLAVGLGAFVETLPTSGNVGATISILGNNLTGASSVNFNGTLAKFKVVSSTEITTTVPSGATTGPVKVKIPSGTLTSNVNFRVS